MAVPLHNVYYLLCYAWDRLEARSFVDVGAILGNHVENLLAHVLRVAVAHLVRRGLDRGYVSFEEEGRRLRGKLMVSDSVQRMLLSRMRAACLVDELSLDVPHNRVVKAAMSALISLPTLDEALRAALHAHCRRMHEVTDVELEPAQFRTIQLHRNVARYAFITNICRLVQRSLLPADGTGSKRFHPFTANEQEMGRLFELFVGNFLRREQNLFHVASSKVVWDAEPIGSTDGGWLPEMRTDVMLRNPSQQVVIEAKYYATPYQSHYGTKKLISGHLYQLLTYLSHLRAAGGPAPMGVLLYAGAGHEQRLDYRIGGHVVLVRGVDLGVEWPAIHRSLIALAREVHARADIHAPTPTTVTQ